MQETQGFTGFYLGNHSFTISSFLTKENCGFPRTWWFYLRNMVVFVYVWSANGWEMLGGLGVCKNCEVCWVGLLGDGRKIGKDGYMICRTRTDGHMICRKISEDDIRLDEMRLD